MEKLFISYLRVSTRQQSASGLGLEAQRATVMNYIQHNGNRIIAEIVETESGKNNHRPELLKALNLAKEKDATLVIAKLDRLSRNLSFISHLMDSKVKFICCDMPDANELTISIFASLAQWERKRISERTIDALNAKRKREPSWIPGTPANLTDAHRIKAHKVISNNARTDVNVRHAFNYICSLKESGMTYQKIADALNLENYKTRLGCSFHPAQVHAIWKRLGMK